MSATSPFDGQAGSRAPEAPQLSEIKTFLTNTTQYSETQKSQEPKTSLRDEKQTQEQMTQLQKELEQTQEAFAKAVKTMSSFMSILMDSQKDKSFKQEPQLQVKRLDNPDQLSSSSISSEPKTTIYKSEVSLDPRLAPKIYQLQTQNKSASAGNEETLETNKFKSDFTKLKQDQNDQALKDTSDIKRSTSLVINQANANMSSTKRIHKDILKRSKTDVKEAIIAGGKNNSTLARKIIGRQYHKIKGAILGNKNSVSHNQYSSNITDRAEGARELAKIAAASSIEQTTKKGMSDKHAIEVMKLAIKKELAKRGFKVPGSKSLIGRINITGREGRKQYKEVLKTLKVPDKSEIKQMSNKLRTKDGKGGYNPVPKLTEGQISKELKGNGYVEDAGNVNKVSTSMDLIRKNHSITPKNPDISATSKRF